MLTKQQTDSTRRFLQLVLRGRWDVESLSEARLLAHSSSLDWNIVCQRAQEEGVAPLIYHTLRGQEIIPPEVEEDLRQAYHYTGNYNNLLLSELGIGLQQLAQAGIPCIILKGAALIETLYKNIALRPMVDVDILVKEQDVLKSIELFSELGYTPEPETWTGTSLEYLHAQSLRKTGAMTLQIEVHWSLIQSPSYRQRLLLSWFWERAEAVDFDGMPAYVLKPEAQLLHLCLHLWLHHGGEKLLWWIDVAELLQTSQAQINWREVLTYAQRAESVLPLQQTLPRIAEEWGVKIPSNVIEQVLALKVSPAEKRLFDKLAIPTRTLFQAFYIELTNLPTWGQRLEFAINRVFPSSEYMQRRYQISPFLAPLYYPYRWWQGLRLWHQSRS